MIYNVFSLPSKTTTRQRKVVQQEADKRPTFVSQRASNTLLSLKYEWKMKITRNINPPHPQRNSENRKVLKSTLRISLGIDSLNRI
jgi:hypothetical protein